MAKKSQTKNKTTKKTKTAPVAVNPNANPPNKTLRSKGFFYVSEKPKDSGRWRVMFESWKDGKKKQTQISPAMFAELGLTPTMTVAQARAEIKKYNKIRKTSLKITASQVRALRRLEELKAIDKTLFPDDLVDEFVMRVQAGSDGKPRFKNRLITNFKIVMEMAKELKLQPHDYSTNQGFIHSSFQPKGEQSEKIKKIRRKNLNKSLRLQQRVLVLTTFVKDGIIIGIYGLKPMLVANENNVA